MTQATAQILDINQAVSPDVKLTDAMILGFLEFHQVPEMKIPLAEMTSLWAKHNLDGSFLDDIRPVNAFKRATSQAGTVSHIEIDYQGKKLPAKLLVRNIIMDKIQVLRHLVREVVVEADEKPYYDSVGWFRFNRSTETMDTGLFPGFESEYNYQLVLDDADNLFDLFVNNHTKDTVRNLINKVIDASNPTPIMPNSQGKFIPKPYVNRFMGLKNLLVDIKEQYAPGTDCQIDLVPVVNTAKQREIFSRKAESQLKSLADELITEFAEYIKTKPEIKVEVAQRMVRDAQELIDRTNEYEKIMGTRMQAIEAQLQHFMEVVQIKAEGDEANAS